MVLIFAFAQAFVPVVKLNVVVWSQVLFGLP